MFSFSRPAAPWFAWEWLSDVIFAWVYRLRGLEAVAALAAAVIAAAAVLLFLWMLGRGCGLWISAAAALAAISAGSVHFLARPHIFSLLLLVAGLWLLDRDRRYSTRAVWLAVPMSALWANLHGGFLVWIAVLGLAAAAAAWERDWLRSRRYLLVTVASALATLANPYGWRLHQHILGYLSSSWILDHVQEFQSPRIRSENMEVFAVLLLAGAAGAALAMARGRRFEPLLVWCFGLAALRSARHVPLYALAAAPLVASEWAALWQRAMADRGPRSALRLFWELGQDFACRRRIGLWGPLAAAALLAAGLGEARIVDFPGANFPVAAIDKNIAILAPPGAMPRLLTSDQWADYLLFRLYPRQRVFFDGRSDSYGPQLGDDYQVLEFAGAGWREMLAQYGFELALLPRDWPLGRLLAIDAAWERVYDDGQAALYRRRPPEPVGQTPIGANVTLTRQARRAKDSSPRREPWEWQVKLESPGTGRKVLAAAEFLRPVPGLIPSTSHPQLTPWATGFRPPGLINEQRRDVPGQDALQLELMGRTPVVGPLWGGRPRPAGWIEAISILQGASGRPGGRPRTGAFAPPSWPARQSIGR